MTAEDTRRVERIISPTDVFVIFVTMMSSVGDTVIILLISMAVMTAVMVTQKVRNNRS